MACEYKISIVNKETDIVNCFISIKPSSSNFDSFKEAIYDRFPILKNQPLYIFYNDSVGDTVTIHTLSDFKLFQEQKISKVFIIKDRQPKQWYSTANYSVDMLSKMRYKICHLNEDSNLFFYDKNELFASIKSSSPTFESFKEAVCDRYPMFQNEPLHVTFHDSCGIRRMVETEDNFRYTINDGIEKFFISSKSHKGLKNDTDKPTPDINTQKPNSESMDKNLEGSSNELDTVSKPRGSICTEKLEHLNFTPGGAQDWTTPAFRGLFGNGFDLRNEVTPFWHKYPTLFHVIHTALNEKVSVANGIQTDDIPNAEVEVAQTTNSPSYSFPVEYLGCIKVNKSSGVHISDEEFKMLRTSSRPIRGLLHVYEDKLCVVDNDKKELVVDQAINKIRFWAPDFKHERGFSYICWDSKTQRWMCHGFIACEDSGKRLSDAVSCAIAQYGFTGLERKQRHDTECATLEKNISTPTRNDTITEGLEVNEDSDCNENKDQLETSSVEKDGNGESEVSIDSANGSSNQEWTFIETNEVVEDSASGGNDTGNNTVVALEEQIPAENTEDVSTPTTSQTQSENVAKVDIVEDSDNQASLPILHLDPRVNEALIKLADMGFKNEDDSLTELLEMVNGSIPDVLQLLQ